ncbi:hypothetical protein DPMN_103879 [Dreissena polymorpha]|uniref:Uncharacterized protein n=1 Tax=Dreissena polymorpha TaxID=45954 RepID=A0A9D4H6R2_DREPO|nr:hypothetical protein DPMN_103879 [Dreissena polymorpha]
MCSRLDNNGNIKYNRRLWIEQQYIKIDKEITAGSSKNAYITPKTPRRPVNPGQVYN